MYLPMGLIVLLAILFFSMLAVIVKFNNQINRREQEIVRNYYRISNSVADVGIKFWDTYGKDSDEAKQLIRLARKIEYISRAHMENVEITVAEMKQAGE